MTFEFVNALQDIEAESSLKPIDSRSIKPIVVNIYKKHQIIWLWKWF